MNHPSISRARPPIGLSVRRTRLPCLAALSAVVALALASPARAQLSELENPGATYALQQRPFRLVHELDITVSSLPLDVFYKGYCAQASYLAHFTETFAWQVGRFAYCGAVDTGFEDELFQNYQARPTPTQEVNYFFGSDLVWRPLFGKLAVLNRWLVYADLSFMLGATVLKFTDAFRPALNLGGGVRVFATRNVSFRLDVMNHVTIPTSVKALTSSITNVMAVNFSLAISFGSRE